MAPTAKPEGSGDYPTRPVAEKLRRHRGTHGWAMSGATDPCVFGRQPVPMLLVPIAKSRMCRPHGGGNNFPSLGRRRKLPPTAKMASGPRPLDLNPLGPAVPGGLSRPGPGPAAVPAHLAGHWAGAKPPRVLRSPSQGPLSLLRRGSHPAGEEAPSLISSAAPEMAGERCPRGGRREVSTVGRREQDFPIRSPRPDGAATTATAPDG